MSWYMMCDFYGKNKFDNDKDKRWRLLAESVINNLKSLCPMRSFLDDEIESVEAPTPELGESASSYTHNEYVGLIKRTDIKKFQTIRQTDSDSYLIDEGEHNLARELAHTLKDETDLSKYMSMPDEEKDKYISLYYVKTKHRRGQFYNYGSFNSFCEKLKAKKEKTIEMIHKHKEIQLSMDYLKLSSEEKDNVDETFNYCDEEFEELNYKIWACEKMMALFSFYTDDFVERYTTLSGEKETSSYHDVVAYIYSD